ncbi:MFS transporter [Micrococcus luteus]|uniref:MFS transporter n=1 Tax=Micrococcus luteus TaxID=1270 RepID=UPI001CDB4177|nr:MFS transporter [Micrococcus luteus]
MISPLIDDTTAPENAARAKRLGHARWLVASNALDAGGRSATDVAIDVLAVLVLGVGAAQMGVLMTLSGLGFLLLGVPIGILVDRHLSPRLLVATDLAKAALLGTLVLAWALDALTFAHLAAVMALLGVLTVLAETTQATLVPRVVAPDTVSRLAARLESADAALGLIVPAAAGLLVAALGAGPVLGIAAAFLAAAALVALKVRMNPAPVTEDTQDEETPAAAVVLTRWSRFWSEAAHGWTTLRRTPVLWLLTLNSMAGNIGMALFAPIEAVWVLTDLQLGPEFVGFQLTAGALGALTVSALAPRAIDTLGEKGCILAGAAGCAAAVALHLAAFFDRAHAGPLLLAGAALWGFMVVLGNITSAAIFARSCPEGTLGRVTAMRRTLTRGSVPLATLAGGALGAAFGPGWVLAGWQAMALLSLAFSIAATRLARRPQ